VVCDDVNRGGGAFKVVAPVPECLEDGKEFLIVGVIARPGSSSSVASTKSSLSLSLLSPSLGLSRSSPGPSSRPNHW